MVDKIKFEDIAKYYGHYASWAIWAQEGLKPKSNVGDLSVLDMEQNPTLLSSLRTDVVMVGLNISRPIDITFGNFHDKRPQSQDYKIRYALRDTIAWGAYMTDIIKDFEHLVSGQVASYLKANRKFELSNVELFKEELRYISASNPTILAFGNTSYEILERHFGKEFHIIKLPHYSMQISKENYRVKVDELLKKLVD